MGDLDIAETAKRIALTDRGIYPACLEGARGDCEMCADMAARIASAIQAERDRADKAEAELAATESQHIDYIAALQAYVRKLLDETQQAMRRADKAEAELAALDICDVCAGEGDPGTGSSCACGGSGRMADTVVWLRLELDRNVTELAGLRERVQALIGTERGLCRCCGGAHPIEHDYECPVPGILAGTTEGGEHGTR